MATLKEPDPTSLKGSDEEEDAAEQPDRGTPERRHVDALLSISEGTLTEPEPHEHPCASGWEEAVRGWARVAPLSCIFSSQRPHRKAKHKEADSPSLPNAESSAGVAGSPNGVKSSVPLAQQAGCCTTLPAGASEWTVLGAVQKSPAHLLLRERTAEEDTASRSHRPSAKHTVPEHAPAKPGKHSSKLVPIKNFTFLPPIKPPQLSPTLCGHLCSSMKASDEGASWENSFLTDKRSVTGTMWGPAANAQGPTYSTALLSKCPTCQHNLGLFSTISVPVPKRHRAPASPKRHTVPCGSFSPALPSTAAVGHAPGYLFS